ncbi:MAG: hypothetical protein F4209_06220 [Chloroflexi bacterium]|nr:hypothetical protein [Chloroflexota bacterium]
MTKARQLTPLGIERARAFLAEVRANPSVDAAPPHELIFDGSHAEILPNSLDLSLQPISTRRDAADFLRPVLRPVAYQVADQAGFWSWLGIYLFTTIAPRDADGVLRLSPLDETFVFHSADLQSYRRRYRHYLWSAWRLDQAHGESAAFLLDEPVNSFGDIADRVFSKAQVFNSVGVVPLILQLYTADGMLKPQFGRSRGGLRHLIRVLDQLERTYDVYGMELDALLAILPPDFDRWKPAD